MFIITYNLKAMKNLKRFNARLIKTVAMQDKEMYVFIFEKEIYDLYISKFGNKDIFLNDKLFFI